MTAGIRKRRLPSADSMTTEMATDSSVKTFAVLIRVPRRPSRNRDRDAAGEGQHEDDLGDAGVSFC